MRVFLIGLGSALLTLAGCAMQEPVVNASTAPVIVANANTELSAKTTVVCHKDRSIGSNMIHSVCEAAQSDADRLASQDRLRDTMLNNNVAHPAVGSP
jgi:hypothetical protein